MFVNSERIGRVSQLGAPAGSILRGAASGNHGLRLRILQNQSRGDTGAIRGGFVILNVGDNKHSESLQPLLGEVTDAVEVIKLLRQYHPGCVSVANANILASE